MYVSKTRSVTKHYIELSIDFDKLPRHNNVYALLTLYANTLKHLLYQLDDAHIITAIHANGYSIPIQHHDYVNDDNIFEEIACVADEDRNVKEIRVKDCKRYVNSTITDLEEDRLILKNDNFCEEANTHPVFFRSCLAILESFGYPIYGIDTSSSYQLGLSKLAKKDLVKLLIGNPGEFTKPAKKA